MGDISEEVEKVIYIHDIGWIIKEDVKKIKTELYNFRDAAKHPNPYTQPFNYYDIKTWSYFDKDFFKELYAFTLELKGISQYFLKTKNEDLEKLLNEMEGMIWAICSE